MYVFILLVKLTDWPPIGKIAAHSAYGTADVVHIYPSYSNNEFLLYDVVATR